MKTKYDTTMKRIEEIANENDYMTVELVTANMLTDIAESLAIIADSLKKMVDKEVDEV